MSKKITLFVRFTSINFFILLLSTFLFSSCSDDNSPTEPEAQPSLASATIGSGGGILKTDDFELSVPAGAFPTDTKLTLNLIENEDFGFDNVVSREFQLEGLPQSFSQPLTIKIKYSGELTDSSYIALGENVWVSSLNEETISYHLLPVKKTSDYITTQIDPINNNASLGKSTQNEVETDGINFYAVTNYKEYLSNEKHFNITYPSTLNESNLINLAVYLETAYTKIQDLGFSYSRRTKWPVSVTVKKLEGDVFGYSTNSMWGDNYGYMEFNFDKMGDAEEMKITVGHEFFHLVQSLYDPRNSISKAKLQSTSYWIDEACAVWSENLFSISDNYVSDVFTSSAEMVINGAKESDGDDAQNYGYGMASFIKYLIQQNGVDVLVKIYDEIYKGHNSFSAIDIVIENPTFILWDEFLEEYLTYNIYKGGDFKPTWLVGNAPFSGGKFIIQNDTDTIKTFSKNYNNLSAKLYYINVKDDNLDLINENSQLLFKISGNILGNIQIFKENSEESVLIATGEDSVKINNFRSITDAGYVIIAVVTNSKLVAPYTETSSGTLTIKVINKEQPDPLPVITEIYDSAYDRVFGEKRLYTTPGYYFSIKGKNFKDVQKVFANGVEFEHLYGGQLGDTLISIKMLPEFKGHLNIKVLTASGESNEFKYLAGIPIDYITSTDSLRMEYYFTVKYYNSDGILKTIPLRLGLGFLKNELNWNNNQVTINLNKINESTGKSGTGSAIITFSDLENCEIDKIIVDYTETGSYSYSIHYEENNHYFGSEEIYLIKNNPYLENNLLYNVADMRYTTQPNISGILNYYDDTEFSEIDLTVDSYFRRFAIKLFHFHD